MSINEPYQLTWIRDLYQLGQSDLFRDGSSKGYDHILCHIVEGFKASTGSLTLFQGDGNGELFIVAGIGIPKECIGSAISSETGVIGWVIKNVQPILLKGDVSADPRFNSLVTKVEASTPRSALCWPLVIGKQVIGTLSVNSLDERIQYTEKDLKHGGMLIKLITIVIENIKLHQENHQRIELLASTVDLYQDSNQRLQETHIRLEQSEKRLTGILDSLDSIVWSMAPDTLEMIYLNKAVEDVSGHPAADFFTNSHLWLDIIHPHDRKRVENSLVAIKTTGVQKITYRILRPDGELRWLFQHMRVVNDDNGASLRVDSITVDITQHKNDEDLLKLRNEELQTAFDTIQEVQAQLVQSEKMATVGVLAAGVAHEINNPIGYVSSNLASLKSYVEDLLQLVSIYEKAEPALANTEQLRQIEMLKHKIDLDFLKTDVLDLLQESDEGTFRVKKIVQDLKDFSHAGSSDEWQWANLHAVIESTLNIVNNEIKYKGSIVKEFGDIPEIKCLPHQLNQVFMNLLVNAAHAIGNNGIITIRTGTDDGHVWIEVSDDGSGIAPEHLSKIYDPFFTTKPVGKGTGLGLSVSYNIIKKHKGEIQLLSQVGKGTTFRVVLPIGKLKN